MRGVSVCVILQPQAGEQTLMPCVSESTAGRQEEKADTLQVSVNPYAMAKVIYHVSEEQTLA